MRARFLILFFIFAAISAGAGREPQRQKAEPELVYLDGHGVIRWRSDKREVRLFGANYCLPTALDYRAAGVVGADRKQLVVQDMLHFARMGWDAIRFSFWGDWECCDVQGNLIQNDHLDLLDFTIAESKHRGIYSLLSPIVTYDARWPEMKTTAEDIGFSSVYDRGQLGTNPKAIKAEKNYLRQLLNHVNRYTGVALKDEPSILFIEMINEPWHHPEHHQESVDYINQLVDAVRSTGCRKLTFHNLTQSFAMTSAIQESKVDGYTVGWYPSGLNSNHQLFGNFLRYVDDYKPLQNGAVPHKPHLVYEFDMPDVVSGYHYPAMARTFRQTGNQFATMFSYDMSATAPWNLGWTTHLLNLVYTPQKAASAVIAAEVMRRLPSGGNYGEYPRNRRFGDFRVSYEENLAELNAPDAFMNSGDTKTLPKAPSKLRQVVGFGSSPIVQYEGSGLYFLDKWENGTWRLEVYPDVVQIADPFRDPNIGKLDFRLVKRTWPIKISLPDLGKNFYVRRLDSELDGSHVGVHEIDPRTQGGIGVNLVNPSVGPEKRTRDELGFPFPPVRKLTDPLRGGRGFGYFSEPDLQRLANLGHITSPTVEYRALTGNELTVHQAQAAVFDVRPGVYLLSKLPNRGEAKKNHLMNVGLREYSVPDGVSSPPLILISCPREHAVDLPLVVRATVVSDAPPKSVRLRWKSKNSAPNTETATDMQRIRGMEYGATVLSSQIAVGTTLLTVEVDDSMAVKTAEVQMVDPGSPVRLFDPSRDFEFLATTRSGESRNGAGKLVPLSADGPKAFQMQVSKRAPEDFTNSLYIGKAVADRENRLTADGKISVRLRTDQPGTTLFLTLVDRQGAAWGAAITATDNWENKVLSIADLKPCPWVLLPQGYPGDWNYWRQTIRGAKFDFNQVERLQLSFRKSALSKGVSGGDGQSVQISNIDYLGR